MSRADHYKRIFNSGYICAITVILRSHGDSAEVRDAWKALGTVDPKTIGEYDCDVLRKHGYIK